MAEAPPNQTQKTHSHASPEVNSLSVHVNSIGTRIRILEERYLNLRKKNQVTDNNMLEAHKRMDHELKAMNTDLLEMKRDINDLRDKLKIIVREVMDSAKKQDLAVLKKYLDLWEPVKFVTTSDVARIARDVRDGKL